jgi:hypothetical protein
MQRRELLRALGALSLPGSLIACGGGGGPVGGPPVTAPAGPVIGSFTSDKAQYYVGDKPVITANFSGASAVLEPGRIALTSGTPVTLAELTVSTVVRLVVGAGAGAIMRELALPATYRNTMDLIPMGFARSAHVAVEATDARVLILGGDGGGGTPPLSVMAFDINTNGFSAAGNLMTGRTLHSATVLADGSILVYGGDRTVSNTPIAERFDPRSGISRPTLTQPSSNRRLHSATLLADGRVLFAGGLTPSGNASSNTVDLFDPQTEQFTRLTMQLLARYGHTAALATSNRLILYGGATITGQAARPEVETQLQPFDPGEQLPRP